MLLAVLMSGCSTMSQQAPMPVDVIKGAANTTPVEISAKDRYTRKLIKTDRYTKVDLRPLPEQLDLLSVTVSTKIPSPIQTVKQAVEFLLMRSGYTLLDLSQQSEETAIMMSNPLPEAHRNIQTMTLRSALTMLAGPAFDLKENDVYRSIMYTKK